MKILLICILNSTYYSHAWLNKAFKCIAPHKDMDISNERNKNLKILFLSIEKRSFINLEFDNIFGFSSVFSDNDSIDLEPL